MASSVMTDTPIGNWTVVVPKRKRNSSNNHSPNSRTNQAQAQDWDAGFQERMQERIREHLDLVIKWKKMKPWLSEEFIYKKLIDMREVEKAQKIKDRIREWASEVEKWRGEWEEEK